MFSNVFLRPAMLRRAGLLAVLVLAPAVAAQWSRVA